MNKAEKQLFPFWKGVCPEPPDEDLNMCRFICSLQSRIRNIIRHKIKKDGYPKTNDEVLEYINTASSRAMKELVMLGYVSK